MTRLKLWLTKWALRLIWDSGGGLSFGGPGTNSIRDIINTINGGGGVPAPPVNSVQYNEPLGAFNGSSEFVFVEGNRVGIAKDVKLVLDENEGANSYWIYNSLNDYMEMYVDGGLRAQF